jgi:predicted aminopeptidase
VRRGSVALRSGAAPRAALVALVALVSSLTSGCYLGHLAAGQVRLLCAREPLDAARARSDLAPGVRERLDLVPDVRAFAATLGLDVGAQYTSYAPWPDDRIVTAVISTRPGEIEPAGAWFPIVGTVPYKGFFSRERAEREAEGLRAEGRDVCLAAVPAYSTLGWLDDPVTQPMLRGEPGELVEMLVHELVHRTVFVAGDANFNEGLATFVGQEASVEFAARRAGAESAEARHERTRVAEDRTVSEILGATRARIAALYADAPAGPERDAARARLGEEARAALAALPLTTRDAAALAARARLGDACLALEGTYTADLARYARRRDALGGLAPLVAAARAAARTPAPRVALLGPPI